MPRLLVKYGETSRWYAQYGPYALADQANCLVGRRHGHRAAPYTPPPPDAEGNPPCEFGVTWETFCPPVPLDEPPDEVPHGTLVDVEKRPIVPNRFVDLPDHFAVVVRTKDGRHITEDDYVSRAATGDWDSVVEKSFIFRTVDPLDVKEVLLTSSKGTCWVQGNP
jgi:hypothetical protein